jgi:ketosteroid isomerase-like protein
MHAWEKALATHDLEGLLACYAPDAILESPVVAHITGGPGIRRGHDGWRGVDVLINDQYHRD